MAKWALRTPRAYASIRSPNRRSKNHFIRQITSSSYDILLRTRGSSTYPQAADGSKRYGLTGGPVHPHRRRSGGYLNNNNMSITTVRAGLPLSCSSFISRCCARDQRSRRKEGPNVPLDWLATLLQPESLADSYRSRTPRRGISSQRERKRRKDL